MQHLPVVRFPEDAGVSSRGILTYLDAVRDAKLEHHALLVIRHGKVAAKLLFAPYDDHTPHMLFSLSKSFCSCAAGFAVQEGLLDWNTRLIDVLPEKFPAEPSPWLQSITLHHLLTMGSGLKPESDSVSGADWISLILNCGCDHEPGTHFHYNSHGTYLVSAMVQKATGMTVRDYLIPRLFEPLGMMNADGTPPAWDCCPGGVNIGGWGLWLSCAQIAPFGQCLLQKGVWDGKQVLPPEWLARATVPQIDNANGGPRDSEWTLGYGYQFWMCSGDRYRGDGALSQFCIVDEKRDMVVCCVSGVPDIGKALNCIYDHLFAAADMPPASPETQAELQERLAALSLPVPAHDGTIPAPAAYAADDITLDVFSDCAELRMGKEEYAFPYGKTAGNRPMWCTAGWQNGELTLLGRVLNAPFSLAAMVRFAADEAEVTLGGVGPEARTIPMKRK